MSKVKRAPVTYRYDALNWDFLKLMAEIAHYAETKYSDALQYADERSITEASNAQDLALKRLAESLDAMPWLAESDTALRALAMRLAERIESAVEAGEDVTKIVGWLGPQLQGVLRDLGGTPAARQAMKVDKPVGSRLAEIRAQARKRGAEAVDSPSA